MGEIIIGHRYYIRPSTAKPPFIGKVEKIEKAQSRPFGNWTTLVHTISDEGVAIQVFPRDIKWEIE